MRRPTPRAAPTKLAAGAPPPRPPPRRVHRAIKLSAGSAGVAAVTAGLARAATAAVVCGGGNGGNGGRFIGGGGGGGGGGHHSNPLADVAAAPRDDETTTPKKPKAITLTLVSFAVTRKALTRITAAFSARYEAETGVKVRWRLSFGGSGTQARAVCDGLPGDVVALALPLDVQKIADAGLIAPDWRDRAPNGAVVAESVVGIVVREGNPHRVRTWSDLARPGLAVITANPKTGGGARWNFLALWAAAAGRKLDDAASARAFCVDVFKNVAIQPRDAREASDSFYNQDKGDALLNYENEIIATNDAAVAEGGAALPYVVPSDVNVRVTVPVAVVDGNIALWPAHSRAAARAAATAFVDYMFTPAAQQELADAGFRPVVKVPRPRRFPKVSRLVSVEKDMGGWAAVQARFFDSGAALDGIMNEVIGRDEGGRA